MKPVSDEQSVSEVMTTTSLWFEAAGRCRLRHETLAHPGKGELVVRTLFSGISRGTESLVFSGKVPVSEQARMRGPNMGGSFPFPVKYGYAAVGRIETGPADLMNRTVFCLHPHQDFFVIAADQGAVLPETVPADRAILAANMETALNIVWDAGIMPGDKVAVFGAGVVGSLIAFIASGIVGTETLLVDRDPGRARLAAKLGLGFVEASALEGEFDVLINASGSSEALESAIRHAGMEARIVEASWYGDRQASIPLGGAFHSRRLQIVSSQVGAISAIRRPRWSFDRRMAKALELLADTRLDALISGETDFRDLEAAYPHILSSQDTLCHRIRYS
ncbi:zinc-binding alcohol dehydrogenase [Rhizobium sp. 18065]|uniref:zinc-dependent alcohol dehydrogenase n=1 Tax=Rhizobium sp. 18065 TaxID=2681411 RepID=UPI00135A8C69|nr:zinc-binding alcohol dehydrogenase [Rhizobium sp. 18065]